MKRFLLRVFGLGVMLGFVLAACGTPSGACDATTCATGCCSAGQCLGGDSLTACGAHGSRCNACGTGQMCTSGSCGIAFTGGGAGGGSGGGGGSTDCSPTTCQTGCCANNHCYPGGALDTCGSGGATCSVCSRDQTCSHNACFTDTTPPADSGTPVVDAGQPPVVDAGTLVADAGQPPVVDAGTPVVDAGTPVVDAGTPVVDAGQPVVDAGQPFDAGTGSTCDPAVVISQVYGGAGNGDAVYKTDFVELHNRSSQSVALTGWSIQYASASGVNWQVAPLSGSIAGGGYVLVALYTGSTGAALPSPSISGSTSMNLSAVSGKIALLSTTTAVTTGTGCPNIPAIVDFLGYGAADCSVNFPGPSPSGTTSTRRLETSGAALSCTQTFDNSADFVIVSPAPQTAQSTPNTCTCP